jgi:hypothetical protein
MSGPDQGPLTGVSYGYGSIEEPASAGAVEIEVAPGKLPAVIGATYE